MFPREQTFRRVAFSLLKAVLACLALLFVFAPRARADTLNVAGFSGSVNPSNAIPFISQPFTQTFNVTSPGQTFDFVYGRYALAPGGGAVGSAGCTNGPCITLSGALNSPAGPLSFAGTYTAVALTGRSDLSVVWASGSAPLLFTTAEGGTGQFTIQLLDFFASNTTGTTQTYDQLARITVTQFAPGQPTPAPEPAALLLLGTGLAGGFAARGRRSPRGRG